MHLKFCFCNAYWVLEFNDLQTKSNEINSMITANSNNWKIAFSVSMVLDLGQASTLKGEVFWALWRLLGTFVILNTFLRWGLWGLFNNMVQAQCIRRLSQGIMHHIEGREQWQEVLHIPSLLHFKVLIENGSRPHLCNDVTLASQDERERYVYFSVMELA